MDQLLPLGCQSAELLKVMLTTSPNTPIFFSFNNELTMYNLQSFAHSSICTIR